MTKNHPGRTSLRLTLLALTILATVTGHVSGAPKRAPAVRVAQKQNVFGIVSVYRVEKTGRIIAYVLPYVINDSGRYRVGADMSMTIEETERSIPRSILRRVTRFVLYRGGQPVGTFETKTLAPVTIACTSAVGGFGTVEWQAAPDFTKAERTLIFVNAEGLLSPSKEPGYEAVNARLLTFHAASRVQKTQAFIKRAGLSAEDGQTLKASAQSRLPLAANRRWPDFLSPIVPTGELVLKTSLSLDVDRDGQLEAFGLYVAPLTRAGILLTHEEKPQLMMLLITQRRANKKPLTLLSLYWLEGPETSDTYYFQSVMDIDGDGVGELILQHDFGEKGRYEVFAFRKDKFVKVFTGSEWGC